ncbi:DUF5694 domain-containing protein [Flavobacterium sp.]|uniref:DUF5694 domain-containing protein n=2 Tax=Flavobacterium sp. TaxID=239 RepID=UPI00403423AC
MKTLFTTLMIAVSLLSYGQSKKKQILIIGTFHFANPGLDVAQVNTFDVMSAKSQKELENITNKIKAFGPDKVFVEWSYKNQEGLDKLYLRKTDSLLKSNPDERIQLALRTAKKMKHPGMYAVDYNETLFPYEDLLLSMKAAGQDGLLKKNENMMKLVEASENKKIATYTLTQLLLEHNKPGEDKDNIGWYLSIANKAGKADDFTGAQLVSEWYRRNLYIYSILQKLTEAEDDKVMLIMGAGHTALLREFIKFDDTFEIVELKDVLK